MDRGVRRCPPKAITKGNVEFLPLFKGLTMCNDLLRVWKKNGGPLWNVYKLPKKVKWPPMLVGNLMDLRHLPNTLRNL
jgi:hypothetical protein